MNIPVDGKLVNILQGKKNGVFEVIFSTGQKSVLSLLDKIYLHCY